MKKSDNITIGKTYIVKVSGHLVPVRLEQVSMYGGWIGRNTRTGREVRIRTAAKLRREAPPSSLLTGPKVPEGLCTACGTEPCAAHATGTERS